MTCLATVHVVLPFLVNDYYRITFDQASGRKAIMAAEETGERYALQAVPIGGGGQVDVLVSNRGNNFLFCFLKQPISFGLVGGDHVKGR